MKNIHLFIVFLFISISACKAQVNELTEAEIGEIQFNGVTLRELLDSGANIIEVKSLLGDNLEVTPNTTGPLLAREFSNDNIYLHFEDNSDTGSQYNLTTIVVKTSLVNVKVKDKTVKIEDSITKFDSDTVINTYNGDYSIAFAGSGNSSLSFKINPLTNKISEIRFDVFY